MVRVELYQSGPGELTGFRAVGHAGYAPPGEDIVCAGVSAVTQACVLGLRDHLQLPVSLKAEDGLLECRLPREIPEEKRVPARAILETMVLALREIENGHGRYFALISLDAPRTSRSRARGGRRGRRPEKGAPQEAPAAGTPGEGRGQEAQVATEPAPQAEPSSKRGERRRKGSHRRRPERADRNGAPAVTEYASEEAAPEAQDPALPVGAPPDRPEPAGVAPEPEPEGQVAVAQEPAAESEKRSVLNPFRRRRLRSFKPGRLGRRWRP